MGLAGRDPFFLAQLESEKAMIKRRYVDDPANAKRLVSLLEDTCLRCHGAMGRHQFHAHNPNDPSLTFAEQMCRAVAEQHQPLGADEAQYGALARDGVSCMVCHRLRRRPQPEGDDRPYLQFFLETSTTGKLYFGPPDEIYGPFKDDEISAYPMQHALGITPKQGPSTPGQGPFLQSSQMCGSCHTVTLPAIDLPIDEHHYDELNLTQTLDEFRSFHHHVEQSTYLEWLNSEYENEYAPDNPNGKSCQDCHMSTDLVDEENGLRLDPLKSRMAVIQDDTYPDAENLAPLEDLKVRVREQGYRRHNFSGLNLFLIEMFNQFDDVLGVRTNDFMTGSELNVEQARKNFLQNAKKTATVDIAARFSGDELVAEVRVTNLTGHRFPSGVGFRRAWLEFLVVEETSDGEEIVWGSGRTNELGVIVDNDNRPLASEFFSDGQDSQGQVYQPHHELITRSDQAQIYETLLHDADGRFSTSFLRASSPRKDNRLLPRGWRKAPQNPDLTGRYLHATYPEGRALEDPSYQSGAGEDRVSYRVTLPEGVDPADIQVRVTLNYQAFPPYFLRNLFRAAPESDATRRLHFLLSHAELEDTPIAGWKLPVATATTQPARATDE